MMLPLMKLVEIEPRHVGSARHLPDLINQDHYGARLVGYLARIWPKACTRETARRIAGIEGPEPRHAASFEWMILRINDTLPKLDWVLDDEGEKYSLKAIERPYAFVKFSKE
jgi:hypothetical protein